jgi:hypothetical protein
MRGFAPLPHLEMQVLSFIDPLFDGDSIACLSKVCSRSGESAP